MRIGPGLRMIGSLVVLSWAMCSAALAAPSKMALEDIGFLPAEAYDIGDGLPALSVVAAAVTPQGQVWLGTMRGLVSTFLRAYLPGPNSLWRIAARVQAPTLVIGGTTDKIVDARVPAQVAKVIPDSRGLIRG